MTMLHLVWLFVLAPVAVWGQTEPPDFSGTWKLDEGRSRVSAEATLAGLIAAGAPPRLHVTHPANGTLVVESPLNESHARLYVPGRRTTTPIFLGEAGTITTTATWNDHSLALVADSIRESPSGRSTHLEEAFSLSADGETLKVEITVSDADDASSRTSSSTLVYTRILDVGPCESWPSPCKDFSSLQRK